MSALSERWEKFAPRERLILIIFGLIAVLALIYFLFLSGGGGKPEGFTPKPGTTVKSATPTASPKAVPQTFEVFEGKDPFQPLIVPSSAPSPQPSGSPTASPTPGPDGGPNGSQRVSLLDISTRNGTRFATVEVDGKDYDVKKGDTFAGSYRVLDLTASCGTFVFGDERFTLCVGQEVIK